MITAFELPERYSGVRSEARALAAEVEPFALEADSSHTVHPAVRAALMESGLCDLTVPERYGGRYESVDPVAICVAREAFMPVSAHLDALFSLQGIGSYAISVAGSSDQREEWLSRVARAEALAALALTEPQIGSDLRAVKTRVEEADGTLRLDGHKSYISNAGAADFYAVFAREGDGYSMVLVPSETPGVTATPGEPLNPPHVVGEVLMEGVELPSRARIGSAGEGFRLVLATLGVFRVTLAAAAVGLGQAALDEALRHTTTRTQFGKPLAELGAVAAMLADTWTEIEMSRLLCYRAAELARDEPGQTLHFSSMAKVAASEAAGRATDRALQMLGRFGVVADSKVEHLHREARPLRIVEGSSEVLRLSMAKALTEPRKEA